ncbi:MAG TPA: response regulator [Cyclobacteriaceae bacterium]|jgi:CheY-like chemotaxis protein
MDTKPVEILLVEDRPEDAEMTIMAIKDAKLVNNIHWVEDGEEALDFIFGRGEYSSRKASPLPSLILLDLKLPKVNGLEVLAKIKQDPKTKKIPVVILTTSKTSREVEEAYTLGANSYIIKPVDFEKFVTTVREIGLYWILVNYFPEK